MSTVNLMGEPFEPARKNKVTLGHEANTIPVLDKGYVKLVDHMGSDLKVVNAARISFDKWVNEMTPGDAKLIHFLAREDHLSPMRHSTMSFVVRAPLMIARQHFKYVVNSDHSSGQSWNENSRRYITEAEEFYIPKPEQWRSAPENKKQGSGGPVPLDIGSLAFQMLMEDVERQEAHYKWALDNDICPEQARLFLPAYGLYITYMWTASLQAVMHFLHQRLAHDSQEEMQAYAQAVSRLAQPLFPVTFDACGL